MTSPNPEKDALKFVDGLEEKWRRRDAAVELPLPLLSSLIDGDSSEESLVKRLFRQCIRLMLKLRASTSTSFEKALERIWVSVDIDDKKTPANSYTFGFSASDMRKYGGGMGWGFARGVYNLPPRTIVNARIHIRDLNDVHVNTFEVSMGNLDLYYSLLALIKCFSHNWD